MIANEDTEMARAIPFTYEIWGTTDGRDLIAVRRSGEEIVGFNSHKGRVWSAGRADKDGGTAHLAKLKYYRAIQRAVDDFNAQIREGKLARIR